MVPSDSVSDRRVLVVEDEMLIAMLVADMLTDLGCKVIGPASGVEQALALIDSETIDLAMVDVNLSGDRSYPIIDVLNARGVPFIFATGHDRGMLENLYPNALVVQKPFHRTDVRNAIEKSIVAKRTG